MKQFVEIERKFLVKGEYKHLATKQYRICQGYLSVDPMRTVRVRIKGDKGFITIKSASKQLARFEWEKEISTNEAEQLLALCLPTIIDKVRYIVPFGGLIFEVDEFMAANEGLVMAEVELDSEEQKVVLPSWIGKEVTGNVRYYNSYLSENPFSEWSKK